VRIAHLSGEWRIRHHSGDDPLEDTVCLAEPISETAGEDEADEVLRFARSSDESEITLRPALADLPIVSHPTDPFFVLPGDEAQLFVSTPLRLGLRIGATRELCELPIVRPSDTWVGATTGDGEAAYSSRTSCRLRLEDLPFRPHRAVTVVHVRNRAADPLRLERITVAVPHLSLYASPEGRLWTESITLTRDADDPQVTVEIAAGPPPETHAGQALAAPRKPVGDSRLQRAFDALF
jgi:hypothetical protein